MPKTVTTFTEYQLVAEKTAVYPGAGDVNSTEGLAYVTMGLVGEAGEIANKVKKIIRDNNGEITDEHRNDLCKELGDVMWYVAALASQMNRDLSWICEKNAMKLASRAERGVLQGSGDNR